MIILNVELNADGQYFSQIYYALSRRISVIFIQLLGHFYFKQSQFNLYILGSISKYACIV